ncbi:Rha family transcriptional regulator [Biformimicrobium ophioploci]|uniref:Rha family transcriptional regulator n=1 Tax=Biformimicrobium ophioploci TaxID=3036711 RepID=UPI00332F44C6
MSSLEIAEIVEARHDSVKRTVERLADRGLISQPPMVDGPQSANGVVTKVYLINQRDSYVVVAQLSPEFTARLVDRWQSLAARPIFDCVSGDQSHCQHGTVSTAKTWSFSNAVAGKVWTCMSTAVSRRQAIAIGIRLRPTCLHPTATAVRKLSEVTHVTLYSTDHD